MIIALDVSSILHSITGIGHYTFNLIKRLGKLDQKNQYRLFSYSWKIRMKNLQVPQFSNYEYHDIKIPGKLLLNMWRYFRFPTVNRLVGDLDLFHSPNYLYQPQKRGKTVCTIHDLAFLKFPGYGEKYGGKYFASVLPGTIKHADAVIVDSEATRNDLVELVNMNEELVNVIHLGIDPEFANQKNHDGFNNIKNKLGLGKEYLLAVTTLEPRKNLDGIIQAMAILKQETNINIPLVICGGEGWENEEIYNRVRQLKLESNIRFAGYVEQDLLPELYRHASLTLFPSLYEGFGLPILESMVCGTPVITSIVSSMPEIA
ncbi:MAG: hypothetical protein A2161_11320, partial [Candidatus Schekmanbacteria bacterium RBG_13_48_7]